MSVERTESCVGNGQWNGRRTQLNESCSFNEQKLSTSNVSFASCNFLRRLRS
ncbi:MAG: hypothetical protein ACTS7I_02085 [Candidatus Hodgkinia cicadicola]